MPHEDSVIRVASAQEQVNRSLQQGFTKRTRTLIDGPNSGRDVEYLALAVDVSGSTVIATANFSYAEDSVHVSGDFGAFMLAVRNLTGTTLTSAEGDYSPVAVDGTGKLLIRPTSTEDAASAGGEAGYNTLAVRNDTGATTTSADGDFSHFAVDLAGRTQVVGAVATDAPAAGNPLLGGARVSAAVPTAMSADNDIAPLWANRNGRLRALVDRPNLAGIYYASGALSTVTAAADAATAGRFWLINPVGSTVLVALRQIAMNNGAGLLIVTTTTPQFTLERMTFTGTASGGTVTAGKRDTNDAAAQASIRTATTGLTPTAGAVMNSYSIPEVVTAVGTNTNTVETLKWPEDERIVLRAGEGLVLRQATAGTALDTRWVQADWIWEEFTALGNA